MTSAPRSHSTWQARGPATLAVRSTTRRPSIGRLPPRALSNAKPGTESSLHDLARRIARERVDDLKRGGQLVACETEFGPIAQRRDVKRGAGTQGGDRYRCLAPCGMGRPMTLTSAMAG